MRPHRTSKIKLAYWRGLEAGWVSALVDLALPRNRLGDTIWSTYYHCKIFGESPRIWHPRRFNEHLLRLKLSEDGRSAVRAATTDKELAKDFGRERLGEAFVPRTIAVLRSPEEATTFDYPARCAIKATHTSGDVILRREGEPLDRQRIAGWFRKNQYERFREPNYRHLAAKVIVEELLSEPGRKSLIDYKIFCYRGVPAFVMVISNRFSNRRVDMMSPRWRALAFGRRLYPPSSTPPARPRTLEKMLAAAGTLTAGFSFVRADFYDLGSRCLVGELTHFPAAATGGFDPDAADFLAGRLFDEPFLDVEELFGLRSPCA